jgi:hypothetical protein
MKCEEMLALLNEYVDGTIDPGICADFEKHMAGCNPCQIVVDNIRQTITLYQNGQPCELPAEFSRKLHTTLRKCWQQHHPRA